MTNPVGRSSFYAFGALALLVRRPRLMKSRNGCGLVGTILTKPLNVWLPETSETPTARLLRLSSTTTRRAVAALDRWSAERDVWMDAELPARAAMAIFEKLYALHGRMAREAEGFELVVGDGILSRHQPDGSIFHPVLLRRAQLVFDAQVPVLAVVDSELTGEFYTGLFHSVPEVDPLMLWERRKEFETGGYLLLGEASPCPVRSQNTNQTVHMLPG